MGQTCTCAPIEKKTTARKLKKGSEYIVEENEFTVNNFAV